MGELCGRLADYGARLIYGETRKFVYGEVPTNSACSAPLSAQKNLKLLPGQSAGVRIAQREEKADGGGGGTARDSPEPA